MSLKLTITSYQRLSPGQEVTKVIDQGTMVIGRAPDNDWVLPDPERYLSGKHCIIEYRNGTYFITDTSANGVFINDAEERLGRGRTVKLNNGDRLTLGDYQIVVDIEQSGDDITSPIQPSVNIWTGSHAPASHSSSPLSSAEVSFTDLFELNKSSSHDASQPLPGASIPEDADLLLGPDWPKWPGYRTEPDHLSPEREPIQPPNAVDQELIPPDWDELEQIPSAHHSPLSATKDGTAESRQLQAEPMPAPQAASTAPSEADKRAVQAFLAGAGMAHVQIPDGEIGPLMTRAGEVFRQMVQGLMEVLMARNDIKSEFRLSQTRMGPVENNPLKFSIGIDDAMIRLLIQQKAGYMPPKQAVREGFDDIKAHQLAVMAGMQAALNHLLKRFDPQKLEKRLGHGSLLTHIWPSSRKAKYWDLFRALYEELVRESEDDFEELFGREFARAYEEQIRKL